MAGETACLAEQHGRNQSGERGIPHQKAAGKLKHAASKAEALRQTKVHPTFGVLNYSTNLQLRTLDR
jgi:hypothetical protein